MLVLAEACFIKLDNLILRRVEFVDNTEMVRLETEERVVLDTEPVAHFNKKELKVSLFSSFLVWKRVDSP